MKRTKLHVKQQTIRNLGTLHITDVHGRRAEDQRSEDGTCHCASQRAHSGCPC
jgi:hypothetical protein